MAKEISMQDLKTMFAEVAEMIKETNKSFKLNGIELRKELEAVRIANDAERKKEEAKRKKEEAKRKKEEAKRKKEETKRKKEIDDLFKKAADEREKSGKEFYKRLNAAEHLFTSQWGKLVESLVDGAVVKIFNERGIQVNFTSTRVGGVHPIDGIFEFDIIAHNGDETIVIEVKTTLKVDDVKHHLEKLDNFKNWLPKYKNDIIYGAIAYLRAEENSLTFAQKKGLYLIRATGDSASIINPLQFKPKPY